MQGGEEREAEHQSDIRMENTEEPTLLTETQENVIEENVIDMQEKGAGVKRGQSEHAENLVNGKLRRREGIKRGLRDIDRVSYEEYDNSWDLEDQSKRCKRAVNCLLVSCGCKRETAMIEPIRREQGDDVSTVEHSQTPTMPVHVIPVAAAEQGKRARTQNTTGTVQPVL